MVVTPFAEAAGSKPVSSTRFETRLMQELKTTAHERAAFRVITLRDHIGVLEAKDVRTLAAAEGASYVVVGTWASRARDESIEADVELRSGHSGATAHRYRVELDAGASTIDVEAERVAMLMMEDLDGARAAAAMPAVSAPAEAHEAPEASEDTPGDRPARKRTDFLKVSRDQPIEISSEELELIADGDTKHLIFTQEVSVVQGDMHLYAGRIEAIYPDGASQPDRLDASHNVRVVEGDIEVHCLEATYLRNEEIVICRGNALLVQGCDEVRGNEIEFDIGEERVKVTGAASVVLRFDLEDTTSCPGDEVTG